MTLQAEPYLDETLRGPLAQVEVRHVCRQSVKEAVVWFL